MLAEAGYDLDDVVTAEVTVTREFDLARNIEALHRIWAEVFADVAVKLAAGQLRVADALTVPGMLVEIELLTARGASCFEASNGVSSRGFACERSGRPLSRRGRRADPHPR